MNITKNKLFDRSNFLLPITIVFKSMSILRKLHFIFLLLLPLSLQACKKNNDNAPPKLYKLVQNQQVTEYYKVKAGDTLTNISTKYGCNYQDIARWNNIEPPYNIIVGQRLKIFTDAYTQPPPINKVTTSPITVEISTFKSQNPSSKKTSKNFTFVTYIVKKGDTLYSISRHFKVERNLIAAINNLLVQSQLNIGRKLNIPNMKQKHSKLKPVANQLIIPRNMRFIPQKTSIISNNKENMLKFYCQWPISGKIVKTFTKTGRRGIEISGYTGQKVRVVAAGIVVAVNASIYGYGKFVVIKHANNYMTSYANNQRTLVKRGQKVIQGQVIAELGKIGYKSPHLKFEIRKAGKLINPMYFLPTR